MDNRLLVAATAVMTMWASAAHSQSSLTWTQLSDGSRIAAMDDGQGGMVRYRCMAARASGAMMCIRMASYSTFGMISLFQVEDLPEARTVPESGFRCSIEPMMSYSQDLFMLEAGSDVNVLTNHQTFPDHPNASRVNSRPWSAADVSRLASQNAVDLQSMFFDCGNAYRVATRFGGIRALFTTQYVFPTMP